MFSLAASVKDDFRLTERKGWLGSAMPNQEELERLDLNVLAMYCLRVAESHNCECSQANQARELKAEWALFIGHKKPPIPGLETAEDIEAYGKQLKNRMVSFLVGCWQNQSLLNQNEPFTNGNARRSAASSRS